MKKAQFRFNRVQAILLIMAAAWACLFSCQQPEVQEKKRLNLKVMDDLSRYDSVWVILIEEGASVSDTLHAGKVSGSQLPPLEMRASLGGKVDIRILGFVSGKPVFEKILVYDGARNRVDSAAIRTAPMDLFRLEPGFLKVKVNQIQPFPSGWVEGGALTQEQVIFRIQDTTVARINGGILGLREGVTSLRAVRQDKPTDSTEIRLVVEGIAPQAVQAKGIQIVTAGETLYIGGPALVVSAKIEPDGASQVVRYHLEPDSLAAIQPNGILTGLRPGFVTLTAVCVADSTLRKSVTLSVIKDIPVVDGGNDTMVAIGASVKFRATVKQEFGGVRSLRWNFGLKNGWDFASDSVIETFHSYPQAGTYTATVAVVDSEGNEGTDSREIKVVDGPVVKILEPKNNSYTNQRTIPVRWMVNDAIQMKDTTELLAGTVNLVVRTYVDGLGRTVKDTARVFFDNQPPSPIKSTTPVFSKSSRPVWSWTSAPDSSVEFRVCDNKDCSGMVDTVATPEYLSPASLGEGVATLYVQGRDLAYNWTEWTPLTTRIDTTAPVITDLKKIWQFTWMEIHWATSDRILEYRIHLEDSLGEPDMKTKNPGFRHSTRLMPPGPHSVWVTGVDSAGNVGKPHAFHFTFSSTPPPPPAAFKSNTQSPTMKADPRWTWSGSGVGPGVFRIRAHQGDTANTVWTELTDMAWSVNGWMPSGPTYFEVQERGEADIWSESARDTMVFVHPDALDSSTVILNAGSGIQGRLHPDGEMRVMVYSIGNNLIEFEFTDHRITGSDTRWAYFNEGWDFQIKKDGNALISSLQPDLADSMRQIVVLHYWPGNLEVFGSTGIGIAKPQFHSMALNPNQEPVIAASMEEMGNQVQALIYRNGGSTWENVGAATSVSSRKFKLAIALDGTCHLLLADEKNGNRLVALKHSGTGVAAWTSSGLTTAFGIADVQVEAAEDGSMIAMVQAMDTGTLTFYRSVPPFSSWTQLGAPFPNSKAASLAVGKNGRPFFATLQKPNGKSEVYAYNATSANWTTFGSSKGESTGAVSLSLVVDRFQTPVVFWLRNGRMFVQPFAFQ